jgi:transcriptional regulator with XRE-family HTH domain
MKLLFTADWLRRKIASDPDVETEAGRPLANPLPIADIERGKVAVMPERNVVQLRIALGTLVHQLRLRERLTLQELAARADVSEEELRQVETNPTYTARPRLIYHLSHFFGVSLNNLSQMSGSTLAVDRRLYNEAVQYAAHSDDVAPLTDLQLEVLNGFVAVLNESAEGQERSEARKGHD